MQAIDTAFVVAVQEHVLSRQRHAVFGNVVLEDYAPSVPQYRIVRALINRLRRCHVSTSLAQQLQHPLTRSRARCQGCVHYSEQLCRSLSLSRLPVPDWPASACPVRSCPVTCAGNGIPCGPIPTRSPCAPLRSPPCPAIPGRVSS